jgi:3-methylcrotonyl-CoA carboxylase alpha subunit
VFCAGEALLVETRWDGGGAASAADGAILAPMPGKVIAVDVAAGEAVTKGQRLLVLEAMKMEHTIVAPGDGRIAALRYAEDDQVEEGAVLLDFEEGVPEVEEGVPEVGPVPHAADG